MSALALTSAMVLAFAPHAQAAVAFGARIDMPKDVGYNYSNSLDYTGSGSGFKLHDAFTYDWNEPAVVLYTRSSDGVTWSKPKKVSGAANAEGSSLATAGNTVIAGWMTGYSWYDDDGVPRRLQVNVSTDKGANWGGVTNLTSSSGKVDYPIVAASVINGHENVYAAWIDSNSGKVKFRQSTDGGATWSSPISLGSTTATLEGTGGYGFSGYANIAAVGDLISVVWVADNTGTLKVRSINAGGNENAPATVGNWNGTKMLTDKMAVGNNDWPIASASPANEEVVTIGYTTTTATKYTTFTGGSSSASAAGTTVWTIGSIGGTSFSGAYDMVVEPAPGGGYVAQWTGCQNTADDCDYGGSQAKMDLLSSTSADGTTWSAPARLEVSATGQQINDEPSIVVIPDAAGVKVFTQYNVYKWNYGYYDVWTKIGTGTL
jgi:hypothetical protein